MVYRRPPNAGVTMLAYWAAVLAVWSANSAPSNAAELSVSRIAMPPNSTTSLVVSGTIDNESTFGVTILLEIIPRFNARGLVIFTPATGGQINDIIQVGDAWPAAGGFTPFDTDLSGSFFLNGSIDDNGVFLPQPLTYTGPLTQFGILASDDARGVWDVRLVTSFGPSSWEGVPTTLNAGTVTVGAGTCVVDVDCDDTLFCNGLEVCDATGHCIASPKPCVGQLCDELPEQCFNIDVPAASTWGLVALASLLLVAGTIMCPRQRPFDSTAVHIHN